jgi:hypothetical protein
VNVSNVVNQEDFESRIKVATFIGTLQAGYTNFHYLRPIWQRTTEKDALIGVSMTGIGSGAVLGLDMKTGAKVVKAENERVAGLLGINKAARTTTVKPAGTTSLTLGTSSGIHAWHNDYYIRRVRVGKNEAIYGYIKNNHPELIEVGLSFMFTTEFISMIRGWENPLVKPFTLKEDYQPGNLGFNTAITEDALGVTMDKELNNGRLAMIGVLGMMVQELVTQQQLFHSY